MSETKVEKSKDPNREAIVLSVTAMRHNSGVLSFTRTTVSVLSGCSAGILGLTSLYGFLFYFVTALILWAMLVIKNHNSWHKFLKTRLTFLTHSLLGGLFTYILFWTFSYGMVHVY